MDTNVNLAAPLGVLALLGTCFSLLVILLMLVYSLVAKKFRLAKVASVLLVAIAGIYFGTLLIFSFASHDKALARGQEKHFCEIDCHLAYSLTETRQMKVIGDQAATGLFTALTIKTRFDERTIGPRRGDELLYPNSRVLTLVDDQGRWYQLSDSGQQALAAAASAGTALTTPLRPGESYTTTVVFDLPPEAKNPTLLISEGEWITHFVIGHENSPLHKQVRFQI